MYVLSYDGFLKNRVSAFLADLTFDFFDFPVLSVVPLAAASDFPDVLLSVFESAMLKDFGISQSRL